MATPRRLSRFLPVFDPGFTAAYFDETGLYAFGRQPGTRLWNLERLAECLTLVAPLAALEEALAVFAPSFQEGLRAAVLRRLGSAGPVLTHHLLANVLDQLVGGLAVLLADDVAQQAAEQANGLAIVGGGMRDGHEEPFLKGL